MTKKMLLMLAILMLGATALSAQTPGQPAATTNWVPVGACIGMALAAGLCGLGQGKAVASAVEGMARNPGAAKPIQLAMLIGLAFIESLALYEIVIVFKLT
ncbi:MAG TPA: ATP synthase F0 subunit C [Bryobacteraceae bacterium]|nr:ATP synthase F0 subunit C [Bryobacteraceae bacterium]